MKDDDSLLSEIAGDHLAEEHPVEDHPADGEHAATRGRRAARPTTSAAAAGRGRRRDTAKRRSPLRTLLPLLLVVVVIAAIGTGGVLGYGWLTGNVDVSQEERDFAGPGSGSATITIEEGDTGSEIGKKLADAGVIKTSGPFTTLFANNQKAGTISPGTYQLKEQMTAQGALDLLLDPSSLAGTRVTVPEGQRMSVMFTKLSESTGISVEDFDAAAEDYTSLGIPENPAQSAEGYLWPGTYDVPEGASAKDVLTMMAGRMTSELEKRGIAPEDRHTILTLASIAEKEAKTPDDYGRVARTIDNRLAGIGEAGGRPMLLQLDSTVAYASGKSTISTTPEERASESPYNTYLHPGLPVGPISNPGAATIDAALSPPEGPWLYWVTVNTDTGETVFSTTKAEHDAAVVKWQEWARTKNGG